MTDKRILFGDFEFTMESNLEYDFDGASDESGYVFINDRREGFTMYFESDFPKFSVPENTDREYCLFEIKRNDRAIKLFCPERHKNLDSVVWYFYVELFDGGGYPHLLPGQVRVDSTEPCIRKINGGLKFVEILEKVKLNPDKIREKET